tara:strand:+ start:860 stop:1105 length:246 start_codon:yes stop_codon:yes gene_type:complete
MEEKATHNFYYSEEQKQINVKMSRSFPEFTLNGDGKHHICLVKGIEYTEMRAIGKGKPNYSDAVFVAKGTYSDIELCPSKI